MKISTFLIFLIEETGGTYGASIYLLSECISLNRMLLTEQSLFRGIKKDWFNFILWHNLLIK